MIERIVIFIVVGAAAAMLVRTLWRSWTKSTRCACGTDAEQCPLSGSDECSPAGDRPPECPAAERLLDKDREGRA